MIGDSAWTCPPITWTRLSETRVTVKAAEKRTRGLKPARPAVWRCAAPPLAKRSVGPVQS